MSNARLRFRAVFLLATLVAAGLAVQACGPEGTTTVAPVSDTAAALPDAPSDELAICIIAPKAEMAEPGLPDLLAGFELGRDVVDARKDDPRRIRWIEEDSVGTEQGAADAFHRCLVGGASAVVGPALAEFAVPLMPIAAEADGLIVMPLKGVGGPPEGGPTSVVVSADPSEMGAVAGADAAKRQLTKAGLLRVPGPFGEAVGGAFGAALAEKSGSIVAEEEVPADVTAPWLTAAKAAATSGATALLLVGPPEAAATVAGALGTAPLDAVHLYVIDWSMQSEVLAAAPADARARIHGLNHPPPDPAFAVAFEEKFGRQPTPMAGSGYDAVLLAARAIRLGEGIGGAAMVAALGQAEASEGAFGVGKLVTEGGVLRLETTRRAVFEATEGEAGWYFAPPK
jgi:ABC-type branched-subunit amino acid transport system substrate-binding protein